MHNTAPLVSVIMPVFNGLDFLDQAVYSILRQSYSNLEFLIVDDGSNQATREHLSELALEDQRITVIHEKNSGQSIARNYGLSQARGEYIYFMDSDDIADPNLLDMAVRLLTNYQADTVIFDIGEISESGDQVLMTEKPDYLHTQIISAKEALQLILKYSRFVAPTNYLARKNVYDKNVILFPTDMIFEDQISTPTVYTHSEKIVFFADKPMFWYRRRVTSATGQKWTTNLNATITDLFTSLGRAKEIYLNYFEPKYIAQWHFHRMIRFYNFYFPAKIRKSFYSQMAKDVAVMERNTLSRREKITYYAADSKILNFLYRTFRKYKDKWIK
ncbi:glycosyltransferase family 2 protein [Oenococcus sp.]|uniref:glycosyltransferase family 2 protein n=1 Tax=Oenococcus sp. TaxID=1979414 RepID=UPI0039ED4DB9